MNETEMNAAQESEAPVCAFLNAHPQTIAAVRAALPEDDTLLDVSELFKVLGDSTRCKILFVLLASEMCVCDLSQLLGMSVSAAHPAAGPVGALPPGGQNGLLRAFG